MITVRQERPGDAGAREALLDVAYGAVRFTKTSERLRQGRLPELALVASADRGIVGTVRLWAITLPRTAAGKGGSALLLGPLAVHPSHRHRGIGSALVERALRDARRHGHGAVLLVGDAAFYGRFGFSSEKTGALWLPGPYERRRLLGIELEPGALDGARGPVRASGAPARRPDLAALAAGLAGNGPLAPRAA
jgi:predicted N-acetyltransferase YhbS